MRPSRPSYVPAGSRYAPSRTYGPRSRRWARAVAVAAVVLASIVLAWLFATAVINAPASGPIWVTPAPYGPPPPDGPPPVGNDWGSGLDYPG